MVAQKKIQKGAVDFIRNILQSHKVNYGNENKQITYLWMDTCIYNYFHLEYIHNEIHIHGKKWNWHYSTDWIDLSKSRMVLKLEKIIKQITVL